MVQYANIVAGIVLATYSWAPVTPLVDPGLEDPPQIPPLSRWSDFVYLIWKKNCGADPNGDCMKNFNGIIRHNILNPITWAVALEACGGPYKIGQWPGKTFLMDTDEGRALAGTGGHSQCVWYYL